MLLEKYANPSRKWRDRSRGKWNTVCTFRSWSLAADRCASFKEINGQVENEGETLSTLRWWFVAADGSPSFKDTSGQVENRRRNSFYFAMTICRRWWISVLQGHFGTGREQKEKQFLLCDDDLSPLMDLRPSRTLRDRSRTEGENVVLCDDDLLLLMDLRPSRTFRDRSRSEVEKVSTLWSLSAATDRSASFKQINRQVANRGRKCFVYYIYLLIDNAFRLYNLPVKTLKNFWELGLNFSLGGCLTFVSANPFICARTN